MSQVPAGVPAPLPSVATGIGLMVLAMLSIPLVDGVAKHLSAEHSPLFISWARYAVASLIVLPIAFLRSGRNIFPQQRLGSHLVRTLFLMAAMTLYFLSIARIPLATAISAYFIGPIVATVLAIVWLGEAFTVRKAIALLLGFGGAMFILRPTGTIDPGIVLALASGVCFGCYMVVTRHASASSDPFKTLTFQCVVGAFILLPQALYAWSPTLGGALPFFVLMGVLSVTSHLLSITAFRHADASTLAPLVYLELVASAVVGFYVFGDLPGPHVWIGAAIIVIAGLLLLQRRRPVP